MSKKKKAKKAKKAQKARKATIEKEVNETFQKREADKPSLQSLRIPEEHRKLLEDFPGPKPKPPKKKTAYSGKSPPIPPPPLLDLIHNFLKDFKYIKAAHGVRTDNQKRPGHNMQQWKWTSDGMPNLLEIFLQWQEQNPGRGTALGGDDPTPKRTEGMTLGVYGTEPGYMSNKSALDEMKTKKSSGRDSSASPSSSEAGFDDEMSVAGEQRLGASEPVKKRKITDISSEDLRSGGESEDLDSESSSSSSSSSESNSESESESDSGSESGLEADSSGSPAKKKLKTKSKASKAGPSQTQTSKKKKSRARDTLSTSSESDSGPSAPPAKQEAAEASSSTSSSKSSDDGDSSEESSSDNEDDRVKLKTQDPKKTSARKGSDTALVNGLSDSSATLPPNSDKKPAPDRATSASLSESSSESSSEESAPPPQKEKSPEKKSPPKRKFNHEESSEKANVKRAKMPGTPFSRIPSDLIVDERFSSNSYRPYDYADRAHQDLSVTKGKGFTKEKNKKKRGQSFRGGNIDITGGGRAVKFDD